MTLLKDNFRSWWQYPRKVEDRSEHRSVAFLELFYDLVYVVFIAELAHSLMSINAVKAVNIGAGIEAATLTGETNSDEMRSSGKQIKFNSNQAGGILGGISSGQNIIAHLALKPTSSIGVSGKTVNSQGEASDIITKGRHDPCVGIRAVPIAEAMLALTLMDHYLRHRAQNADVVCDTPVITQN